MTDKEKFEGFKEKMIEDNKKKYGKEIRKKYGEDVINRSNEKLRKMTEEDYEALKNLEEQMEKTLSQAFENGDPASDLAQKAADLHKQWLTYFWDHYSKEAHSSLAQMYVEDERFKAYYDREQQGTAAFFRDAILIYTGIKNHS